MKVDRLIEVVQSQMADDGVYRTDAFVLTLINDAIKMLATFTLYYELTTTTDIEGTRNYGALPEVSGEKCLAPLYVADLTTGYRINPTRIEEFEFHQTRWEGVVGTVPLYYTTTGAYSPAHSGMVFCPVGEYGKFRCNFMGAYVPVDLVSGDTLTLTDQQIECVVEYCRFMCYTSEPARAPDMFEAYKKFLSLMEGLVKTQSKRYPSGRDTEPVPVEFQQLSTVKYEKRQPTKTNEEASNEG
jgi:hypothetical protein